MHNNTDRDIHQPSTMTSENEWEQRYQSGKIGWDRGTSSHNLHHWLDSKQLKPCRIMVPGCGNGYEVITLAQQGFEVVCIDIAVTAVDNLRAALAQRNLQAEVIHSDFFALDFSSCSFDAIYEQTCLCALDPKQWPQFVQWMQQSLKTDGILYSHFMQTHQAGGPPFHCDMTEMHRLFTDTQWHWQFIDEASQVNIQELKDKMEIPCMLTKR